MNGRLADCRAATGSDHKTARVELREGRQAAGRVQFGPGSLGRVGAEGAAGGAVAGAAMPAAGGAPMPKDPAGPAWKGTFGTT
jgi:hypothetical protein